MPATWNRGMLNLVSGRRLLIGGLASGSNAPCSSGSTGGGAGGHTGGVCATGACWEGREAPGWVSPGSKVCKTPLMTGLGAAAWPGAWGPPSIVWPSNIWLNSDTCWASSTLWISERTTSATFWLDEVCAWWPPADGSGTNGGRPVIRPPPSAWPLDDPSPFNSAKQALDVLCSTHPGQSTSSAYAVFSFKSNCYHSGTPSAGWKSLR